LFFKSKNVQFTRRFQLRKALRKVPTSVPASVDLATQAVVPALAPKRGLVYQKKPYKHFFKSTRFYRVLSKRIRKKLAVVSQGGPAAKSVPRLIGLPLNRYSLRNTSFYRRARFADSFNQLMSRKRSFN